MKRLDRYIGTAVAGSTLMVLLVLLALFSFGAFVAEYRHSGGRITDLRLSTGAELAAELVVVAAGVVPNAELAAAAGLPVDNGVVVDGSMRTADPTVSAIGDCA